MTEAELTVIFFMAFIQGLAMGWFLTFIHKDDKYYQLEKSDWQPTASHREGPEHDQHDVCDQYTRKGK